MEHRKNEPATRASLRRPPPLASHRCPVVDPAPTGLAPRLFLGTANTGDGTSEERTGDARVATPTSAPCLAPLSRCRPRTNRVSPEVVPRNGKYRRWNIGRTNRRRARRYADLRPLPRTVVPLSTPHQPG